MTNFIDHTYDKKAYNSNIWSGGVGLGVVLALPFYVLWFLNSLDTSLGGYATFVQFATYAAVFLYMGFKAAKIYSPQGTVAFGYGRAYGHAMLMSLIAGAVNAILMWLLNSVIAPEYSMAVMDHALDIEALKLQAEGYSAGQIEEAINFAKWFTGLLKKIYVLLPASILGSAFIGALVALITSLLVKKDIKRF